MKIRVMCICLLGLFAPSLMLAQRGSANDLDSLLRDSAYVFNRFEEVSTGLPAQIERWQIPSQLKATESEALSAVLRNEEATKTMLSALLGKPHVSSADVLDVYTEMVEVASELQSLASDDASFGNAESTGLSQLGAKAQVLAAKIGVALRSQITSQEAKLASCSEKKRTEHQAR